MKLLALALCATSLFAAETASQVFDGQLSMTEKEFVSLVEAMPAKQFGFAPTQGTFKGVRTFGAQATHVAGALDGFASSILGEKPAAGEEGPDAAKTKEQIVKYVKDAFAHAHKAVASLTSENLLQEVQHPFDAKSKWTRLAAASEMLWHTFDHYGQMVEYARMNNIVPPASR